MFIQAPPLLKDKQLVNLNAEAFGDSCESKKNLTYIRYQDINNCMEERIINILLDIKADIGDLKKGQTQIIERVDRLEGKVDKLDERVGNLEEDMSEVKSTVNALAEGLLETSREVKQIKGKSVHA